MSAADRQFEFVQVDDSADARLLVELSSHAADLVEARDALALAIRAEADADSPLGDAQRSLVAHAAMAYCRTFFASNVRRPITDFIAISDCDPATHELVRLFRNRVVAHSQSDLSVTYAVGILDATTREVLDVMAPTISSTMPLTQVRRFARLVDAALSCLDEVIEPVRARVVDGLRVTGDCASAERRQRPAVREYLASEFTAARTRPAFPVSHPVYFDCDDGVEGEG